MKSIRRRALRAGIAVILVATVSLAGASMNEWWRTLPPPEECTSEDLLRWLATRDLDQEPAATRRALVDRLAVQLSEGVDVQPIDDYLDAAQKRRFTGNVRLLVATWFEDAAATYAALDARETAAFLDEQIALVQGWDLKALAGILAPGESLSETAGMDSTGAAGSLAMLNAQLNRWVDDAQGTQREKLLRFASAIRMRLVARAFQPVTPTSSTSSS